MNVEVVKFVQTSFGLIPDGIVGPMTLSMLEMSAVPAEWSNERKVVGYFQMKAKENGFDPGLVDGYWGPQTQHAWDTMTGVEPKEWRDDEGIGGIPSEDGWPLQTQLELTRFYGNVGENQSKANSPYPLRIAWDKDKTINRFTCHEKVKDSIERVLQKVLDHYGLEKIQELGLDLWGGCLNVRAMRGGTKYSTHSWGMAIDWDPERNRLRWSKDKANFAKPEYDFWWSCWEEEGWVSLGRAKNYDWMHVQAAKVK